MVDIAFITTKFFFYRKDGSSNALFDLLLKLRKDNFSISLIFIRHKSWEKEDNLENFIKNNKLENIEVNIFYTNKDIRYIYGGAGSDFLKETYDNLEIALKKVNPKIVFASSNDLFSVKISNKLNIPVFYFLHSIEFTKENIIFPFEIENIFKKINIVVPGVFLENQFFSYWKKKSIILAPIDFDRNLINKKKNSYITLVNANPRKGAAIFVLTAMSLPQYNFLATGGWLERKDFFENFNLKNLKYLSFQDNPKKIWENTKILMVPSFLPESLCRVVLEAGLNSIPTLANNIGELKTTVGKGGILFDFDFNLEKLLSERFVNIKRYRPLVDKYILKIIKLMNNNEYYNKFSIRAFENAVEFKKKEKQRYYNFKNILNNYLKKE